MTSSASRLHALAHDDPERVGGLHVDDQIELVGCRTGRSAGLAPLRIRHGSLHHLARRAYKSAGAGEPRRVRSRSLGLHGQLELGWLLEDPKAMRSARRTCSSRGKMSRISLPATRSPRMVTRTAKFDYMLSESALRCRMEEGRERSTQGA